MSRKLAMAAVGVITAALSLVNGSVFAQDSRYIKVGETEKGEYLFLDTEKIEGTYFKLYTLTDTAMYELSYYASCGETRLFYEGGAAYSRSGHLLTEKKESEEMSFSPNSPAGKAMVYVCRSVHARGW
ncbi:hypothetical protein [Nostoc sp. TCL26-01]|uniref:hypothetical protein n=1 Tax=Nostoc sp. TCL26-01 TaxID=2576904 RepID=UPI0015BE3861|nr:hypothetical protein [Nostoc sp. TCL26-01]QLE54525.1 hypothetical protein FD725_02745 [Nostoc sp. TCL26-01]